MAELMIQYAKDKLPSTDAQYAKSYLVGDVIAICPDGWVWSNAELTNTDWRLVKIPGVDPATLAHATSPRIDPATGEMLRKRDYYIDPTQIPTAVKTFLATHQVVTLTVTQAKQVATWIKNHSVVLDQT